MKMTIEEAIRRIDEHNYIHKRREPRAICLSEAFDVAIDTMHKYQKIEKVLSDWINDDSVGMSDYWMGRIKEVIEDVNYGEDITKVWTTAVEQASVIQKVKQKTWVEAYDSFKKEYETRLKADMVAILEEFDLELSEYEDADLIRVEYIRQDIQEKINLIEENKG